MKENKAPKRRNAARSAATIVRLRRAANGTRGEAARDSTQTKAARRMAEAAKRASVDADPQPWSTPRFRP
jgi:hypothetical protein